MSGPTATAPSRLRIAHVDSERGFSGGEVQVFLLLEGLRKLGHETLLICQPDSRGAMEARRRGIAQVSVRMRNDLDWFAVRALARVLKEQRVDLVHLHTGRTAWLGGLAARSAAVPAVSSRRMDRQVKRGWRTYILYRHLLQRVVAISPAVVSCLRAADVPAERIELIPEGVEVGRLRPERDPGAVRAALGAKPGDMVILTLAALVRRKGLDVLLKAAGVLATRGLRPCVWIAGDGPEGPALAAQIERMGLSETVRLLGRRSDTVDLLATCDIFVLPSRREGLGVSALEAMAMGRAVVASAVGGLSFSVVHERTGLLVPPDDAGSLAIALERLLEDETLRNRLAAEGPKRIAEGFLAEQMVATHDELYRAVMGQWNAETRQA